MNTLQENVITVDEIPLESENPAADSAADALLPDEDLLCDLAELFKIFGDSTRCRILYALAAGERNVSDLASVLSMTQHIVCVSDDSRELGHQFYALAHQIFT